MNGSPPLLDGPPIGRRLRMRREALGMSAQALAATAGISPSHLSRIERGHHRPTWDTVERLYRALGIVLREEVIEDEHAA